MGVAGIEVEVEVRLSVLEGREEVDFVALSAEVRVVAVPASEALVFLVEGGMGVRW